MAPRKVPIDKGFSWVVVFGASVSMFFVIGGFKSMGILFVEILKRFGASQGLTAVMFGVISGGMSICSPFMTALGMKFSMRVVVMCGGFLLSIAAILTAFAPNIYYVICVFGVLTGIGFAALFAPALTVVSGYFDKRRSIANGLAMAGASIGQLTIPLLITFLVSYYSFQGALLVYGAFCLHILVGGALMRPLSFYTTSRITHEKPKSVHAEEEPCSNGPVKSPSALSRLAKSSNSLYNSTGSLNLAAYQSQSAFGSRDTLDNTVTMETVDGTDKKVDVSDIELQEEEKRSCSCSCLSYDFSVLKNRLFLIYLIGICLGNSGYADMVLFIPPHAHDCGLDQHTAAILLSICGVSDFFGRILGGWFADLGYVKRSNQMGVGLIVVGLFGLGCTFVRTFTSLVVLCLALGLVGGIYVSLMAVVLVDFIGPQKFPSAFGLTIMFMGFTNLALPGIFGKIRDVTGSYTIPYCICAALMLTAGVSFLTEPLARRAQNRADGNTAAPTINEKNVEDDS